jgi:hypothetical protein
VVASVSLHCGLEPLALAPCLRPLKDVAVTRFPCTRRLVECSCAGEGTLRNNSSMLRFAAVSEPVVSDYDMSWLPDFSGGSAEDLDTMLDSICTPAVSTKPDLMPDSAIGGFCQPQQHGRAILGLT